MLEFTENMGQRTNLEPTATLTLTWEQRGKCRQRLRLDSGEEVTFTPGNTWIEIHPSEHDVVTTFADGTEETNNGQ